MTIPGSGNYTAAQGQKEYEKRGACSCGSHDWKETQLCEFDIERKCQTKADCIFEARKDCVPIERLKCRACGSVGET